MTYGIWIVATENNTRMFVTSNQLRLIPRDRTHLEQYIKDALDLLDALSAETWPGADLYASMNSSGIESFLAVLDILVSQLDYKGAKNGKERPSVREVADAIYKMAHIEVE